MRRKIESPMEVQRWFREQAAELGPAGLGSLTLRHNPCVREHCGACLSGKKHPSHVLYGRTQGRRFSIYVPDELVPEVRRCLDNGLALQELMYQTVVRFTKALKHKRTQRVQKVSHEQNRQRSS